MAWADFETGDELRKTVTEKIRKSKCMPNDDAFASSILINTKESRQIFGVRYQRKLFFVICTTHIFTHENNRFKGVSRQISGG